METFLLKDVVCIRNQDVAMKTTIRCFFFQEICLNVNITFALKSNSKS